MKRIIELYWERAIVYALSAIEQIEMCTLHIVKQLRDKRQKNLYKLYRENKKDVSKTANEYLDMLGIKR